MSVLDQGVDHRPGVLALYFGQHHITRVSFYQGCDLAAL